ncbi:MAG: ABC transporter permease [Limnochordales bacterium]
MRHRLAAAGLVFVILMVAATVLGPILSPYDPNEMNFLHISQPPSRQFPLGTDELGRDLATRLLYGGRISLAVGVGAVAISTSLGLALGALSGFLGGRVDAIIMRVAEIFLSVPTLLAMIAIAPLVGPSPTNIVLALGIFGWPGVARVTRGQVLQVRSELFVEAATAVGGSRLRIIARHVLPNIAAPVIVAATLQVATAILTESSLSFLGLGVQPPTPTWGNMLHAAQSITVVVQRPWQWLAPGAAIALTVLSINFIGDGLRDALDPRWQKRS